MAKRDHKPASNHPPGWYALHAWIAKQHLQQCEAAKLLGWSESYLCRVLGGSRRVRELRLAEGAQRAAGIPLDAWSGP